MKTKKVPFDINKAKAGLKVITRDGHPARIVDCKVNDEDYPILGLIYTEGRENPNKFTINGKFHINRDEAFDLFIEEEVEETDDYDPYKATVESIADMAERYSELQSLEELKHFYNNVRVKCRDAFEYGKVCMINQDDEPADNKPKFKVGDKVVLKHDKSLVGSITFVSFIGTYSVKFKDFNACWYSEQELEPYEMIEKEVKTRRMTNQELADWLRDAPEEHREYRYAGDKDVYNTYDYPETEAKTPVEENRITIRRYHGKWQKPLIEE